MLNSIQKKINVFLFTTEKPHFHSFKLVVADTLVKLFLGEPVEITPNLLSDEVVETISEAVAGIFYTICRLIFNLKKNK